MSKSHRVPILKPPMVQKNMPLKCQNLSVALLFTFQKTIQPERVPKRGVIKVKIEDGSVVSVPERKLKFAGTENEPWEKFKTPAKPKPTLDEILAKHGPEEIYMEPARPGYPKWTGD